MDLDRERRFNALLVEGLALPPGERRAHCEKIAGQDPELAAEVLAALDNASQLGDFLEPPERHERPADTPGSPRLERIGHFVLGERLGVGGMGEVFRATQEAPVRRDVALKLIRAHVMGETRGRFLAEQRALARLSHSHVARFHEAGTTEDGRPWFAMELIDGEPITTFCDTRKLGLEARLRIFLDVCAGVEHAHRHQILHRDLKPSNVLVVEEDGHPVPKVIDFGIAKALDGSLTGFTLETHGSLLGTPAYMSPEALSGLGQDGEVDTRTDVFSLGVLLYELITGTSPFDDPDSGLVELALRRAEHEPERPSTRLSRLPEDQAATVTERRSTTHAGLKRAIRDDLDWITLTALAPDRRRRYRSVAELADDLERFLADQPIRARAPTTGYLLGKLVRRHRFAAMTAAVIVFSLLLGALGLGVGLLRARQQAETARQALAEAREVSDFLVGLFEMADPNTTDEVAVSELLDRGAQEIRERLAEQPAARGRLLQTIADVYVKLGRYDQAEPMIEEAARLFESAGLPTEDPARLSIQRSRGVLHMQRQEWTEAEAAFRRAAKHLDVEDDPETWALAQHNLAVAIYRQSRPDEAEPLFRAALRVRERELDPDHPHLARSFNALGALLLDRRPREAVKLFQRSVEHRRRTLGADHPHLAKSLHNLAIAHRELGDEIKALELFLQVVRIDEKALGSSHPDLLRPLGILGDLHGQLGDLTAAEAARRRHLEITRTTFGERSRNAARSARHLAHVLLEAGRLDRAEALYREVAGIYDELLEPKHLVHDGPRLDLGMVAWKRGQLDRAEEAIAGVLDRREGRHGEHHTSLTYPLRGLAGLHRDRGEPRQAERLYRRTFEIYLAVEPRYGWEQNLLRQDYAALLRDQDRSNEAEAVLDLSSYRRRGEESTS